MALYPNHDNLAEIRSQVEDDEDEDEDSEAENEDSVSALQTQFATQVPISIKQNKPKRSAGSEILHGNGTRMESLAKDNEYLLQILPDGVVLGHNSQPSRIEDGSSPPEIPQMQIVVPSSHIPEIVTHEHEPEEVIHGADVDAMDVESDLPLDTTLEQMPDVILELLRGWRQECRDGRYIPRRLQNIAKDQAKLLESEDRWQPPLVGHTARPGTVPLKLLNHLTLQVDHDEPTSPQPQGNTEAPEDHVAYEKNPNSEQRPEILSLSRSPSPMSSQSDEYEWTPSPDRPPPMRYPADSPPILDRSREVRTENTMATNSLAEAEDQEASQVKSMRANGAVVQSESNDHALSTKRKSISTSQNNKSNELVSSDDGDQDQLPPSTVLNKINQSLRSVQRTIHVKRTPFHTKESMPLDDVLDSSTNMIPGTFDERSTLQTRKKLSGLALAFSDEDLAENDGHENDFELNSSEDETPIDRDYATKTPSNPMLPIPNNEISISAQLDSSNHDGANERNLVPVMKRKPEHDQTASHKRFRKDDEPEKDNNTSRSDYASVDEDRVQYRRQFMSAIVKKRNATEQAVPSVPQSKVGTETATTRDSEPNKATILSSPPTRQGTFINTSETHVSVYRSFSRSNKASTSRSMLEIPPSAAGMIAELYREFKQTYSSYGGDENQFNAAILLLKKLDMDGLATHPSIWDDFIFRHFHDYRPYLKEVMENSGNAMGYESFYQHNVEEPTCRDRIIRPAHLDAFEADSTPATRKRLSFIQTTTNADSHSGANSNVLLNVPRSIAAESSISNVVVAKTNDVRSPDVQPTYEQISEAALTNTQNQIHEIDETLQQANENSQDSRTSVKIWLEKAAGAESPILGTAAVTNTKDVDMPLIDLVQDADESTTSISLAVKQNQRRSLPWTTKGNKLTSAFSDDDLRVGSLVAREFRVPSTNTESMRPSRNTANQANSMSLKDAMGVPSPTPPSQEPTAETETLHQSQQLAAQSPFQCFVRFYNSLPNEGKIFQNKIARTLIDIDAWRH